MAVTIKINVQHHVCTYMYVCMSCMYVVWCRPTRCSMCVFTYVCMCMCLYLFLLYSTVRAYWFQSFTFNTYNEKLITT